MKNGAKIKPKTLNISTESIQNEVGSRLGAIFVRGGLQAGKKVPCISIRRPYLEPFWESFSKKYMFFRHHFLDAFLRGIVDGILRCLDVILKVFGCRIVLKTE